MKKISALASAASILTLTFLSSNWVLASNIDTIRALYYSGTAPAVATDFPERAFPNGQYTSPPANLCVVIDGTDQPFEYNVSRQTRVTPQTGPLVPGKTETKLVFGPVQSSFNIIQPPLVWGPDLVITNPIYASWQNGNTGVTHFVPATMTARKSGPYIAFRVVEVFYASPYPNIEFYGYCYPSGQALF